MVSEPLSDFSIQRVKDQEFEFEIQKKSDSPTLTLKVCFEVTNNEMEYESCIIRFQATMELKTIAEDSSLVISRSKGKWKVKDQNPFNLDQVK